MIVLGIIRDISILLCGYNHILRRLKSKRMSPLLIFVISMLKIAFVNFVNLSATSNAYTLSCCFMNHFLKAFFVAVTIA